MLCPLAPVTRHRSSHRLDAEDVELESRKTLQFFFVVFSDNCGVPYLGRRGVRRKMLNRVSRANWSTRFNWFDYFLSKRPDNYLDSQVLGE